MPRLAFAFLDFLSFSFLLCYFVILFFSCNTDIFFFVCLFPVVKKCIHKIMQVVNSYPKLSNFC